MMCAPLLLDPSKLFCQLPEIFTYTNITGDLSVEENVLKWLVEQRTTDTIEEVWFHLKKFTL